MIQTTYNKMVDNLKRNQPVGLREKALQVAKNHTVLLKDLMEGALFIHGFSEQVKTLPMEFKEKLLDKLEETLKNFKNLEDHTNVV